MHPGKETSTTPTLWRGPVTPEGFLCVFFQNVEQQNTPSPHLMKTAPRPPVARRQNQSQLARTLGCSRTTVWKILQSPNAPKRDAKGCFDLEAVRELLEAESPAAGERAQMHRLRLRKLLLEVTRAEREDRAARGESIGIDSLRQGLGALMAELGALLESKFVGELPKRYAGRDFVEITEMNKAAVDEVARRFKSGITDLSSPRGV